MALFNLPHLGRKVSKKVKPKSRAKKTSTKSKASSPQKKGGRLLEFHGTECPHCRTMDPVVERVERELGVRIEKIEVWHNEKNAQMMQQYDRGYCGGVPFFYNENTNQWLCGETPYEEFKRWAMGKKK